jgi:putative transposase
VFATDRPLYFVTFNTRGRQPILATELVHEAFTVFAARGVVRGAAVGRYVIMPDHIHVFLALANNTMRLASWVKSLKCTLNGVLDEGHAVRPYWQEGFFDHMLRCDESYAEKWAYVRHNPVRKGLVSVSDQWPFQGEVVLIDRV